MDASTTRSAASVDPASAALFGREAAAWWDPQGSSRLLHRVNPVRLGFIRAAGERHFGWDPRAMRPLVGAAALDVGCGGGLLAEPLARMGARVTAIDAAPEAIGVARAHAAAAGLAIDYRAAPVEALAAEGRQFDLITAMEVIEHVADRASFLGALKGLLAPGGLLVFSTPNRTALSWGVMILGAERLTRLIPRGAHDWRRFMTPDEVGAAFAAAGLLVRGIEGITLGPDARFRLGRDRSVNYIGEAVHAA